MNPEGQSGSGDQPGATPGSPRTLRRIEAIFFEVAMLAPVDREAAIKRLCAGDTHAEQEVRSLLASADKVGAFLERPALGMDAEQLARASTREPVDELIGATLGAFKVVSRLASGGMGTVYLGERSDGQYQLKVAVKVVKRGMDSEEILRRFKDERQTLAALDHPNIARLIDGGVTTDGRPFLVMEFVDGVPIDAYCDAKGLKVPERLTLFRQVCDGVHHAHQNLVIHRDIKPSNILVTPQGVPKLLDFGIAKLLKGGDTDQAVTADTDRRLTPEYASPEQVEGRPVTTATDVYSLGVVLYELLTGTRPYHFSLRTSEELKRVVCELVPPSPSEAVTVRPTRLRTKTSGGATGAGAGPTGGGAVPPITPRIAPTRPVTDMPKTRGLSSTRLRGVLRGDLDNIVMLALRKEPQRRYASVEQLSADIGRYLSGMPVQARRDTLAYRANKFVRRHALGVTLSAAAVILLATATVVLYRQGVSLAQRRDELLAANRSLEEARRYLVDVLGGGDTGNMGPDAKLGELLQQAAQSLKDTPPHDPLTRAASEQALGRAVMSLGMLPKARELLESSARGFAALPDQADARVDAEVALGELLFHEGKHTEAEAVFRRLLADERARVGAGVHTEREGLLLNDLGGSLRLQDRAGDAAQVQRDAITARAAVHGEKSLQVAESRNNLASALFQTGDLAGAIGEFQRSLDTRKALLRADHPMIVRCQSNLGLAQLRAGKPDDAVVNLTASAEAWDRAFGPEHAGRVAAITSLSQALTAQGRHEQSVAWLNRALEWQRAHGATAAAVAATEANIGIALAAGGKKDEALTLLRRVVPVLKDAGAGFAGVAKRAGEALATLESGPR